MNLTPFQSKALKWLLISVIIAALAFFGVKYPEPSDIPPFPEYTEDEVVGLGTTHFTAIEAEDLTATNDLIVDNTLNTDDTDSTITSTQTLTPDATFYQFNNASVLTLTLATGSATDGDLLIIQNVGSSTVTVVDTGATVGGGAVTVGANDLALFIFGNTKWIEIASPDNS